MYRPALSSPSETITMQRKWTEKHKNKEQDICNLSCVQNYIYCMEQKLFIRPSTLAPSFRR